MYNIYRAVYRYHLYNAKTLSKMNFIFFVANFRTMVNKQLHERCKGGFSGGNKKGTKIATFLGGKCLNLSYLNNTFLRLVKQSKILIFFSFPT